MKQPAVYILLILLAACNDRSGIPKDIIPPDSMQVIMKDVIVAAEYSSMYLAKDSLKKDKVKSNQDLLEAVFQIHHISKDKFLASLHFYQSRPDLNKQIFDSLSAYANRKRQDLYKPKTPIKPRIVPVN